MDGHAVASLDADGEPQLTYEDVDTSLIPPRPRLYGLVGGDLIEETWKRREAKKSESGTGQPADGVATGEPVKAS